MSTVSNSNPEIRNGWTKADLETALNDAIYVELYTIPLYLTAVKSIKNTDLKLPLTLEDGKPTDFYATDIIMSVAVQEMFHLTLACNIMNSMGFRPTITAPDYLNPPSCLKLPDGAALIGDIHQVIDTMIAIETPDPKYSYDPSTPEDFPDIPGPTGPPSATPYDSIGDMYHALAYGIEAWKDLIDTENVKYQKTNFNAKYPGVPLVTDFNSAMDNIVAIVEQGEGGSNYYIPKSYEPGQSTAQFAAEDEIDHLERFVVIQKNIDQIQVYGPGEGDPAKAKTNQEELSREYSLLLNQLQSSFTQPNPSVNLRGMANTGTLAGNIWANGACPDWVKEADPLPWTVPIELHVCQGLNTCSGHGYKGSGTMAGNGDCATVAHACQYTNDCHQQGACGYPGKDSEGDKTPVYVPGQNNCNGMGGCQSPIAPVQWYPKGDLNPDGGPYVWKRARTLFKARMNELNIPCFEDDGALTPTDRRVAQNANATNPHPTS